MGDVKLNTLNKRTQEPTATQDFLLFDESTNAGERIDYNKLADVILNKLDSKTYTIGGSAKTLVSALNTLEPLLGYNQKAGITDLNNATNAGVYVYTSSCAHIPSATYGYVQVIQAGNTMATQIAVDHLEKRFIRYMESNDWTSWEEIPTRVEVDALNSKLVTRYPSTGWSESTDLLTEFQRYWSSFPSGFSNAIIAVNNSGEIDCLIHKSSSPAYGAALCFSHVSGSLLCHIQVLNNVFSKREVAVGVERGVYTPTITAGTGFACENISCKYAKQGNIMFISGRFNVTNVGSTDGQITISMPSGYQLYDMGVGGLGGVSKDVVPILDTSMCTLRYKNATSINIQKGAGNDSAYYLGTGYIVFYATVFVM